MSDLDFYQEKCRLARQRLSVKVYGQAFSPCGKFLAVCNNFGQIAVYDLVLALSPEATEAVWKPIFTFNAHRCQIFFMTSYDSLLISAGTDGIRAWNWKEVIEKAPVTKWFLEIPVQMNRLDVPEVNSIATSAQDDGTHLYAAGGDNCVHMWDMETGTHLGKLVGHKNYIHAVCLRSNSKEVVSASEDGTVRIWDLRTPQMHAAMLEPYKNEACARPRYGRWVGCLDVDSGDDWMVCGGGPHLALWHLRSLAMTTIFDAPDMIHHHSMFHDDCVISGGSDTHVYHWDLNGDQRLKVPCTPSSVYSIAVNDNATSTRVLTVTGNCNTIDIFTNFGYRAFSLSMI